MIETSQIAALALDYNTDREDLRMPEYGRHVQSMIAYCLTLPRPGTSDQGREQHHRCDWQPQPGPA